MKKLMRRVAAGLALPLVIGVPVVLFAAPAQAAAPMIQLTSSANPSVYGQEVRVTALVFNGEVENVVTQGHIQFRVNAVEQGDPVPLGTDGRAVSGPLFDEGGPLEITVGSDWHDVTAEYIPCCGSPFDGGNASNPVQQRVDKAGSSLAVLPGSSTIVADMSGQLPGGVQSGSLKPSGTVTFTVGGAPVGTAPVAANGRATLDYVIPHGAARSVTASYAGDDRYTSSADATTRVDPELRARVLSKFPRSKAGWYHTPIEVFFMCQPRGSELTADCPLDVTLRKSGKGQSVSRTIHAVDGGTASVLIDGINIDREDPEVSIVNGNCKASDELSGIKNCKLRLSMNGEQLIAIATDKAGNRATAREPLA